MQQDDAPAAAQDVADVSRKQIAPAGHLYMENRKGICATTGQFSAPPVCWRQPPHK